MRLEVIRVTYIAEGVDNSTNIHLFFSSSASLPVSLYVF